MEVTHKCLFIRPPMCSASGCLHRKEKGSVEYRSHFACCCDQVSKKKQFKEGRAYLGSQFKGRQSTMEGKPWQHVLPWWQEYAHLGIGSGEWTRGQVQGSVIHVLQGDTILENFLNSAINLGSSVHTHEPVGDVSHSNHTGNKKISSFLKYVREKKCRRRKEKFHNIESTR